MVDKKVIIVCFTFPPVPGIGGRRWAKFSKYLLRNNIDVQVVTANQSYKKPSDWTNDITELKSQKRINNFDFNYPHFLSKSASNLIDQIGYKLSLYLVKQKIKGNIYDKSALCKNKLFTQIIPLIEKGYNNIIVSVGPFFYSTFFIELKHTYPNLNLVLDVRDPWTNNKMAFGYWALPKERLEVEKKAEELVAKGFDKIITVADEMGEYFVKKYLLKTDSVQTINNGFDYDDFRVNHNHTSNHTIVFTGTLYEKALDSFLIFFNQLNTLKTEYTFHFYGEVHESILPYFKGSDKLFYHEKIALNLVYEKIAESDACLLFLTDDLTFSFSTKFVEYLSQNKPILVFSKPGKTGEFVNQNKLGFQMDNSNLNDVLNLLKNNNPSTYDISSFDVKNLTYKLIDLLN